MALERARTGGRPSHCHVVGSSNGEVCCFGPTCHHVSVPQPQIPDETPAIDSCGSRRERRTVTDYAYKPCRRSSSPLPESAGEPVVATDGARIQIAAVVESGCVSELSYQSSSCVTLVAYAEVLAELVTGRPTAEAMGLTPDVLTARLPGVPAFRQQRAMLVVRAWWSALSRAVNQTPEGRIE